jgi:hypothetical protein
VLGTDDLLDWLNKFDIDLDEIFDEILMTCVIALTLMRDGLKDIPGIPNGHGQVSTLEIRTEVLLHQKQSACSMVF